MKETTRCEFCHAATPVCQFALKQPIVVRMGRATITDRGAWVACQACAENIQARDWASLIDRASEASLTMKDWPMADRRYHVYMRLREILPVIGQRQTLGARGVSTRGGSDHAFD